MRYLLTLAPKILRMSIRRMGDNRALYRYVLQYTATPSARDAYGGLPRCVKSIGKFQLSVWFALGPDTIS